MIKLPCDKLICNVGKILCEENETYQNIVNSRSYNITQFLCNDLLLLSAKYPSESC